MKKIDTLEELKAEQKRLRFHQAFLEEEIKNDVKNIKKMLSPISIVTNGAKKMLNSSDNSLISDSAGTLAKFVAKNVLLKNAGFLAQLVVPFILKNATSNLVENNKSKIADWVGNLVSKFSHHKAAVETPRA